MYVGIVQNETNINKNTCRARAFLVKKDSFLSKQTHKWDYGEEEEEEEGIEIILPEIVPELFTSNEAWIELLKILSVWIKE